MFSVCFELLTKIQIIFGQYSGNFFVNNFFGNFCCQTSSLVFLIFFTLENLYIKKVINSLNIVVTSGSFRTKKSIVPNCEENELFMLGVFLFSQFFSIEIIEKKYKNLYSS